MISPSTHISNILKHLKFSKFTRDVAETQITKLILIVAGLFSSILVARLLGPEGRGLFAVMGTIGALGAQFANLGIHASNTYYVSKDHSLLPGLIGNSFLISFLLGGFTSVVIFWGGLTYPHFVPINDRILLILTIATIPIGLLNTFLQRLVLGIQKIRLFNIITVKTSLLSLGLLVALTLTNHVTVVTVFLTGWIAVVISIVWMLWSLLRHTDKFPWPSTKLLRRLFHYGLKAYWAALFMSLVLQIDILMIKYFLDTEQVGYYSLAVGMANMVYMLPVSVGTVLFPKLSAMENNGEKWESTLKVLKVLSISMFFLVILASLLAPVLVKLLYGPSFLPAVQPFILLMPAIYALSLNTILMNYFASIGMPLVTILSPAIATLLNIAINIKIIPSLGIVGASISSTLSYTLMIGLSITYIYYKKTFRHDSN